MLRVAWWDAEMRRAAYPSLDACCRQFEISARTARRDLDFLRDQFGAPVAYDRRRNGYFYTEPGFTLPAMRLSEGEVVALFLAEKVLRQYQGTAYAADLRAAFAKLCASLPEQVSVDLGGLASALSFDLGPARAVNVTTFECLVDAVQRRRRLEMVYHSALRDQETVRRVDPLHLHAVQGDWYVIAFCHLRGAIREFALSRVRSLSDTGERFSLPDGFDREEYLHESFGVFRGGEPQDVVLRFDPFLARWIRERNWHRTQRIDEEPDGGLVLRLRVPIAPDLVAWVLSNGGHCRVVSPDALRQAVLREVRQLAENMGA